MRKYSAAGTYKFKLIKDGTWLGNNGEIWDTTTATSAIGWEFVDWAGDGTLVATGGTYTFTFNFDTNMLVIEFVHTHAYTAGTVVAPTCTAKCYTVYTCPCGGTENRDEKAALGHNHVGKVTTAATCTADGVKTFTCSRCSDSYTEVITKLGHDYKSVVIDPTCTAEGYTTYICSVCDDTYTADQTAALGHSWNDGVITTKPTCTAAGYTTYTCSVCGESYTAESTDGVDMYIWTAAPVLSDSIAVEFGISIPAGFSNVYMVFELNGEETVVYDNYSTSYFGMDLDVYTFPGLNPQKLGDNICTTVYATYNNHEVTMVIPYFNVKDNYCKEVLPTADAKTKTLISDLLVYAEKSQIYSDYKTDSLMTEGVEGMTPSTFTTLGEEFDKNKYVGTYNPNAFFNGASLSLGNKMTMVAYLVLDDASKYTYQAEVNGKVTTYQAEDLVYNEAYGMYMLYFDDLKASAFNDIVTFSIMENGVAGDQMEYTVNSYVYTEQGGTNQVLVELLKAIYNYGASANALVS